MPHSACIICCRFQRTALHSNLLIRKFVKLNLCTLQDYTDAIEKGAAAVEEEQTKGLTFMQRTRLLDFMHFIEQNMTLFSKHPLLLLQSAANGPDASYVTRSAMKLVDDQMTTFGWFKFLNKSNSSDPCVLTIGSSGAVVSCCFTPDSKKIALGCIDGFGGRATVYDAYTGASLNSHTLSANPKVVAYNSDSRFMMVTTNDGCCSLYDTVNNKERTRGFISTTDLTCAALSLDGSKVRRDVSCVSMLHQQQSSGVCRHQERRDFRMGRPR